MDRMDWQTMKRNDMDRTDNLFGDIIRTYREQHGLTQQQVAERLQLSRNYVSQIERGLADHLSFELVLRILNLPRGLAAGLPGKPHGQVSVTLTRRVMIDAVIAPEIVWLNSQGVVTEGCCAGPPPSAMITPGSLAVARRLGYECSWSGLGLYEIILKSNVEG